MKKIILMGLLSTICLSSFSQQVVKYSSLSSINNTPENQIKIQERLGYSVKNTSSNFNINEWVNAQLKPVPYKLNLDYLKIENKTIKDFEKEYKALEQLKKENKTTGSKEEIKSTLQASGLQMPLDILEETLKRRLIYANESPNQLAEKMNYFWFNHFNVTYKKGAVKALVADYDKALREESMGYFKDILRTSLMHPAMLIYLDNARSTADREQKEGAKKGGINENYARELLELHTMGVDSGYTQKDIQELARILTGFTLLPVDEERLKILNTRMPPGVVIKDGFLFNPRNHDKGDKIFLGHTIKGSGFSELEQVLDLLVNNPNTAQFISKKLAVYFVSDNPSSELVKAMSSTFLKTKGYIPEVLKTMIYSNEFVASTQQKNKFKDPYSFVVTSMSLCGQCDYSNMEMKPLLGIMNNLGQPFMGHQTPDGYSMKEADWLSSTQMQSRFDAAKVLNRIITRNSKDPSQTQTKFNLLKQGLSPNSLQIINQKDNKEKLEFFFATPEWMYY